MPTLQEPLLEQAKEEIRKQKREESQARYLLKYPERRRATYTKYRKKHPEKHQAASKKYYWKNVEARRIYARQHYWKDPEARKKEARDLYHKDKIKLQQRSKLSYQKRRMEVYLAYGGPKCICCGEELIDFLSMDHINGGGTKHRKTVSSTKALLSWLKKNGFPSGFQVLCMQCNFAKGKYGTCPHTQMKTPIDLYLESLK